MYKTLQKSDGNGYIIFDSQSLRVFQFSGTSDQLESACREIIYKAVPAQRAHDTDVKRCETLTIMLTNACNLNCKYCYFHFHPSEGSEQIGTEEIMRTYKKLLEYFTDGVECIQFFGGEPLLHFRIIQEVTEQIILHSEDIGVLCPRFGINTNGLLLKKDVMDFFQTHNFFVRISIDGTERNNAMRVNYQDKTCYSELLKIIKNIRRDYPDFPLHAEMTYSAQHIKNYLSTYIHDVEVLRDLGFSSVHMAPVITPDSHDEGNVFSDSCSQEDLKTYVRDAYDFMFRSLQTECRFYITDYIELADRINTKSKKNTFCNAGIWRFALGPDGMIYPCHMYYSNNRCLPIPLEKLDLNDLCVNTLDNLYIEFQEKEKFCGDCWNAPLCGRCKFDGKISKRFCDFRRFQSEYLLARIWVSQREGASE